MSEFKVQYIRSCVQCGDILSKKCGGCTKHPNRKPRITEIYDWPPILATGPCGCIQIKCQRAACGNLAWRSRGHQSIMSRFKSAFCSRKCNSIANFENRKNRLTVKCAWHLCDTKIERKCSILKTFKHSYCRKDHYYLARKKMAYDITERQTVSRSLYYCSKCRDVTEQMNEAKRLRCLTCNTSNEAMTVTNRASGRTA